MVETRRGSSSSKRPIDPPSSPSPNGKRPKGFEETSSENEKAEEEPVMEPKVDLEKPVEVTEVPVEKVEDDLDQGNSVAEEANVKVNVDMKVNSARPKKREGKAKAEVAWGKLISQCSQNTHLVLTGSTFTVGQGRQCNLWLKDPSISKSLCKLRPTNFKPEGSCGAVLEITGTKGDVLVNGKMCPKNTSILLNGGDEVAFTPSSRHAYIYQHLITNNLATVDTPSPVSILEAHGTPMEGINSNTRSGDTSAVAEASVIASLSNFEKGLSLLPQSQKDSIQQTSPRPAQPPCETSNDPFLDKEMKDSLDTLKGPTSEETSPCRDTEMGKSVEEVQELKSLFRKLSGPPVSMLDFSGTLSRFIERQKKEARDLHKCLDISESFSIVCETFKEGLQKRIVTADDIEVSFEKFPYFLSEATKDVLITSTYIHLKCKNFAKQSADLPSLCPRILLSGPAGSEIYQETLTKALAKHFGAKLLVVDSLVLPTGSVPKKMSFARESSRPEKTSVFSKRAGQGVSIQIMKPTSSVEANITGGSAISSHTPPKQETSTASSKNYTFKKGIKSWGYVQ